MSSVERASTASGRETGARRAMALVGAGPGDPELLTLRAEELLAGASVVVVDSNLEALARRCAPAAQVVAVADGRAAPEVVLRAVEGAGAGAVRLYRGDPWLHPGYEAERAALDAAGLPTEAVAGVAVEVAVPALAGVALHVRRLAVACTLGSCEALPVAGEPAHTLVASGDDPVTMATAMAATGDPEMPVALVPIDAPGAGWRGRLGEVVRPATAIASPALLVTGAVCATGAVPAAAVTAAGRPAGDGLGGTT